MRLAPASRTAVPLSPAALRRAAPLVVLGAGALVFGLCFLPYTVDDAFISWRYGKTLTEAGVWNWNASGARVEAYTNPLYTALSVIPALLRIPVELFFKGVSLALLAAYAWGVHRLDVPRPQRLALWAFALLSPVFWIHLFSGLETVSFTLLTAVAFGVVAVRGRHGRWGHLACLALALSRPEGIALAAAAEAWGLLVARDGRERDRGQQDRRRPDRWGPDRRQLRGGLLVGAAVVAYWLLRARYFGHFFPNTFYQKSVGHGSWIDSALGMTATQALWLALAVGAGLAVAALGVRALLAVDPERLRDATVLVLAGCAALVHVAVYRASDLAMNYADRFSWQILFPVALVALCRPLDARRAPGPVAELPSARRLLARTLAALPNRPRGSATRALRRLAIARTRRRRARPPGGRREFGDRTWAWSAAALAAAVELSFEWQPLLAAAAVFAALVALRRAARPAAALAMTAVCVLLISDTPPRELLATATYRYRLGHAHEALGRAVAAEPGVRGTVAIGDAGIVPYCMAPRGHVYDLRGLADPYLRRGTLPPALLDRRVQLVVAVGRPHDPQGRLATTPTSLPLLRHAYAEKFTPVARLRFTEQAWQTVLVRPGRAAPELAAQARRARAENARPDAAVLRDHFGELPFLSPC